MAFGQNSSNFFRALPPVIKNLLIINVIFFAGTWILSQTTDIDLSKYLALYYIKSDFFYPHQFVTHMFMHGSIGHIFFNMFALWMFGIILEQLWGSKKFLKFYIICGLGAALFQTGVMYIQELYYTSHLTQDQIKMIAEEGYSILQQSKNYTNSAASGYNALLNIPMVGASGAIFGVLMAFGMYYPNSKLYLLFPPIPIKGKYAAIIALVFGYIVDKWFGGGNVAHFAHLGGMLTGYIMIKIWKRKSNNDNFYEQL